MRDKKKKRRRMNRRDDAGQSREAQPEAIYTCQNCGEDIVISIDITAGSEQEFVEDCPVCCHPHVIHVDQFEDGEIRAWAESEADLNN
jgi:transcription elongation factor Elf1